MEKLVKIGDKEALLASNAFTPIKYKNLFGEDLLTGLSKISEDSLDIDVLSKLAYCMALQGNKEVGDMEEWLGQFEMTDFYQALPEILQLWANNTKQVSHPKKSQGK